MSSSIVRGHSFANLQRVDYKITGSYLNQRSGISWGIFNLLSNDIFHRNKKAKIQAAFEF